MIYFNDAEIDQLINEDLPYYDLTSLSVKLGTKVARISYTTRHDTVLCGTEEVLKIFDKFHIVPTLISQTGEHIGAGIKFLEGEGLANSVHAIWRTTANLLEYASGIATRTRQLVQIVEEVNPGIPVVTTRKSTPFTKKLSVKAVNAGGGHLHRLGLSDTVLIFDHHIKFVGGIEALAKKIPEIKKRTAGRSITVEVKNGTDAVLLAHTTVDGIQIDKMPVDELRKLVKSIREVNPHVKIFAAGSIDEKNIGRYATSGVDMLVTSSPYYGKPIDILVGIEPSFDI